MHGVAAVTESNSISAVKPSRGSGQTRQRRRHKRDSANILWKRVTASYDEDVRAFAKNPALVAPITRWALFQHITPTQAMAARRYGDIVREFHRFHTDNRSTSPRSANLEPVRSAEDHELARRAFDGSMGDYEDNAKYAKRQYKRLMKVMARFEESVTGRNLAKDALDTLCVSEQEPPPQLRGDIALVLTAIAKEFCIGEKRETR